MSKPHQIKKHLYDAFPAFRTIFQALELEPKITPVDIPVPEAVVKVVAGQMLSRQAANSIYARIRLRAKSTSNGCSWLLSHDDLTGCGLSRRKASTITSFAKSYSEQPKEFGRWRDMGWSDLRDSVDQFHGMSEWSASMLAIFYFGHEDIYPHKDGSLKRAENQIRLLQLDRQITVDANLASPFRSYLALYLWQALDKNLLRAPAVP